MSESNPYDEMPYGSRAIFEMHPNRMAVVARLFGLDPAPVRTARVLEIGCAEGGNAIPVAVSLPEARVVGIDLSERQVSIGNGRIRQMGLSNVELVRADLAELKDDLGKFDYVCAHGVYSWIAPDLQETLLRACHDLLAPDGIAYVSYNAQPGWSARLVLREMGRYRAGREIGAAAKVAAARRLLGGVAASAGRDADPYRSLLAGKWSLLEKSFDGYFFHDYLEDENNPCWFHEFHSKAAAAGLTYVADALFGVPPAVAGLPGAVDASSGTASGRVEREQNLDFHLDASFRQSLLCRSDRNPFAEPDLSVLDRLHVVTCVHPEMAGADLAPGTPASFRTSLGTRMTTDDPYLKGALAHLRDRFPEPVPFLELARRVPPVDPAGVEADSDGLRKALVRAHAGDVVDLLEHVPPFVARAGPRPVASPLVRLQASLPGSEVTSLLHREIGIEDALTHLLLSRMDGTRDVETLCLETAEAIVAGRMMTDGEGRPVTDVESVRALVGGAIGGILDGVARIALLTA